MSKDTKTKELIEKMRNQLSWIEKDYSVDLYRDAKECASIAEEHAKINSRETAIAFETWRRERIKPALMDEAGLWPSHIEFQKYQTPEEIVNLFIQSQQTENKNE